MKALTSQGSSNLVLGTCSHPEQPATRGPFFANVDKAVEHLCNHLLVSPECHGWALIIPGYRDSLNPEDANARWIASKEAVRSGGASVQSLYDAWLAISDAEAKAATQLAWVIRVGRTTVAMGIQGVLLIVDDVVRTSFLPGLGDARETVRAAQAGERRVDRLGMRAPRKGNDDDHCSPTPGTTRQRARWSLEERIYYEVFRPAVQFIRRQHNWNTGWNDAQLGSNDYGSLKQRLPPMSRLRIEQWKELRNGIQPSKASQP